MQQRRFRPGDVLDDYCPRERRITGHAIVAMIEDHIKQTRCVVCDAEHEYKEGKVPPQRRKRPQAALFAQVLDGLQAPQPAVRLAQSPDADTDHDPVAGAPNGAFPANGSGNGRHGEPHPPAEPVTATSAPLGRGVESAADDAPDAAGSVVPGLDEGPVRRPLIRATLPRPEGQPVIARAMPEFTIRQPHNGRGQRPGGRRHGAQQQSDQGGNVGRFGRGGHGQGQRQHGGRPQGPSSRAGGPRRGGKKR